MFGIGCFFGSHEPDRNRVWHDGLDFRAPCRGCGEPMVKTIETGWRRFDAVEHAEAGRRERQAG